MRREDFIENDHPYLLVLLLQGEFLLLDLFQLITEIKLGGFLLELGELVLVFRHLLQGWFHARMARRHYVINCIQFLKISIKNLMRQLDIFLLLLLKYKERNTYNLPRRSFTWLFKSAICVHWIFPLTFRSFIFAIAM